jgi:UV radiation resistance-associated gene protein
MNPNFQFFDLDPCGPSITRLDTAIVKVWAKTTNMAEFQYIIEWAVQFKHLTYLGKTLESFRHPLPSNCIVFHLPDGVYTSFVEVPDDFSDVSRPAVALGALHPLTQQTSSYDQLMQLATLDTCIQDALAIRDKIKQDIETVLRENQSKLAVVDSVPEADDYLRNIQSAVSTAEREVSQARKRKKQLQSMIKDIKAGMEEGRRAIMQGKEDIAEGSTKLGRDREGIQHLEEDITSQRRRVCEDLLEIFPIEPLPDRQLAFTIRGLYLPNSDFSNCDEDKVAAALGYVAQVVQRLQIYLNRPVPYPITVRASTSTIEDPISMTTGPRTYPLFIKTAIRYRFEYGVFLLNKDIEILANWLGLRLLDIRQTLPNLKYLLYVATAGKGELPARKTGGIRGLYGHAQAPHGPSEASDSLTNSDLGVSKTEDTGRKDAQKPSLALRTNGSANLAYKGRNSAATASSKLRETL